MDAWSPRETQLSLDDDAVLRAARKYPSSGASAQPFQPLSVHIPSDPGHTQADSAMNDLNSPIFTFHPLPNLGSSPVYGRRTDWLARNRLIRLGLLTMTRRWLPSRFPLSSPNFYRENKMTRPWRRFGSLFLGPLQSLLRLLCENLGCYNREKQQITSS